jgi:hypothetical protein
MLSRLAHGISHATSGGCASWQMVLSSVHLVDPGSYSKKVKLI